MTKFLSMDIGSRYIHIVEGFGNKAVTEIKTAYLVDTPLDAVDDGKIVDEPALTQVLRTALSQQRPSTKKAILTIQSTQVISRDFSIPVLKNSSELSNVVSFEMEQYLPSTADDYLIEYYIVEEFEEEGVKYYKIRAAAMPKEIADGYYRLVKGLKLTPVALDIHSNAITKLFSNDVVINGREYPRDKSYALIDIGCKFTALNIISGGKLEISRIISIGGRDIDTAIAPYFNLPLEKTEQKKMQIVLGAEKKSEEEIPEDQPIKNIIDQLILQIQKVFQFNASRTNGNPIEKGFIYGGSSNIKGIEEYLSRYLGIEIVKIDEISSVKNKLQLNQGIGTFLNAAGALIRL